jgi:drug/metabolite transporter (DMT)-like permease
MTVSSISYLNLVFNSILSYKLLGEQFTRMDFFSSVLISIGAVVCVSSSNLEKANNGYDVRNLSHDNYYRIL